MSLEIITKHLNYQTILAELMKLWIRLIFFQLQYQVWNKKLSVKALGYELYFAVFPSKPTSIERF